MLTPSRYCHLPSSSLCPSQHSGFTLIEIMAAMTVFFMVIGILVSGVAQAMRLAEVGQTETTYSRDAAIRLGWFRDTVGLAIIPPLGSEQGPPLTGNTRSLSGLTLQSLNINSAGPGIFAWSLAFNPRTNETELQYESAAEASAQSTAAFDKFAGAKSSYTAFSWAGSNGRFRYLDEAGNWRDQWPVEVLGARSNDVAPPAAIGLEYGDNARLLVVNIQNRSMPPPSYKELLK